jgi:hypothetical protein
MAKRERWGRVGIVCLAAACLGSGVSGQTQRPPASMDDLLAELRAIRAELQQTSGASIRAQLLVGRLQLQEQRINSILQQLNTNRNQLNELERTRALLAPQVKMFEEAARNQGAPVEGDASANPLKTLLDEQRKREKELRAEEAALSAQLAAEQARWVEFSDRLDQIELEIQKRPR